LAPEVLYEGKVLRIRQQHERTDGWVDLHGVRIRVNLTPVPDVKVGDHVLVQGRTALSRIDVPV
jgi:hydrogenase maturation factor